MRFNYERPEACWRETMGGRRGQSIKDTKVPLTANRSAYLTTGSETVIKVRNLRSVVARVGLAAAVSGLRGKFAFWTPKLGLVTDIIIIFVIIAYLKQIVKPCALYTFIVRSPLPNTRWRTPSGTTIIMRYISDDTAGTRQMYGKRDFSPEFRRNRTGPLVAPRGKTATFKCHLMSKRLAQYFQYAFIIIIFVEMTSTPLIVWNVFSYDMRQCTWSISGKEPSNVVDTK